MPTSGCRHRVPKRVWAQRIGQTLGVWRTTYFATDHTLALGEYGGQAMSNAQSEEKELVDDFIECIQRYLFLTKDPVSWLEDETESPGECVLDKHGNKVRVGDSVSVCAYGVDATAQIVARIGKEICPYTVGDHTCPCTWDEIEYLVVKDGYEHTSSCDYYHSSEIEKVS